MRQPLPILLDEQLSICFAPPNASPVGDLRFLEDEIELTLFSIHANDGKYKHQFGPAPVIHPYFSAPIITSTGVNDSPTAPSSAVVPAQINSATTQQTIERLATNPSPIKNKPSSSSSSPQKKPRQKRNDSINFSSSSSSATMNSIQAILTAIASHNAEEKQQQQKQKLSTNESEIQPKFVQQQTRCMMESRDTANAIESVEKFANNSLTTDAKKETSSGMHRSDAVNSISQQQAERSQLFNAAANNFQALRMPNTTATFKLDANNNKRQIFVRSIQKSNQYHGEKHRGISLINSASNGKFSLYFIFVSSIIVHFSPHFLTIYELILGEKTIEEQISSNYVGTTSKSTAVKPSQQDQRGGKFYNCLII